MRKFLFFNLFVLLLPSSLLAVDVKFNFGADLQAIMTKDLTSRGLTPGPCVDVRQFIFNYLNTVQRIIPEQPYEVKVSPQLQAKLKSFPEEIRDAIASINRDAKAGNDLLPRHSRRIKGAEYSDPLFNDWGVYHLHLGSVVESDGFIKRTGELLYVYRDGETLYFLDVLKHEWADMGLVELVHENWPEAIERYKLVGLTGDTVSPVDSSEKVSAFRKAGLSYVYVAKDGATYMSMGGGYMTSGANGDVVRRSNMTIAWLKRLEIKVENEKEKLRDLFYENTGKKLDALELKLVQVDGEFYLLETQLDVMSPLGF